MADSVQLYQARTQLYAHHIGCVCMPCRDARELIEADAQQRREAMLADLDAYIAETKDGAAG